MNNDSNFRNLSCQLGGLTLNGNVSQGTANNVSVFTINDPAVLQDSSGMTITNKCVKVFVGGVAYFIPLYQ
jgi:hypothetical protein